MADERRFVALHRRVLSLDGAVAHAVRFAAVRHAGVALQATDLALEAVVVGLAALHAAGQRIQRGGYQPFLSRE